MHSVACTIPARLPMICLLPTHPGHLGGPVGPPPPLTSNAQQRSASRCRLASSSPWHSAAWAWKASRMAGGAGATEVLALLGPRHGAAGAAVAAAAADATEVDDGGGGGRDDGDRPKSRIASPCRIARLCGCMETGCVNVGAVADTTKASN